MRRALVVLILFLSACSSLNSQSKERAELHLRMGTSHLMNGDYPRALAELLEAEKLDSQNAVIQNNLGLAYFVRDRFDLAEKHTLRALAINSKYSDARNNYSRILIEQGKPDQALIEADRVIDDLTYQNPEKPLINKGLALFAKKNYPQALLAFAKAVDLQRDNCTAQTYLGRCSYEMQKYQRASEVLDLAVSFCQKEQYDEPLYYSALSHYQLGHTRQAEDRLEQILKLYPQGRYRERANKALETIRK